MNIPKVVFLLVVLSGALFLSACGGSPTTPPVTTTGSIRITSVPTGARVFLDNVDKGVTTDCTLTGVATGNRSIKLVMAGYTDYVGTAAVTAGQTATVSATLTATPPAGSLSVTPAGGLTSTGPAGGPFAPASMDFALQNTGGTSIAWTASANQTWLTVSPTSGNLAAAATTTVTVSINSVNANALGVGAYNALLTFTNTTNGTGNTTRPASLTITDSSQPVTVTVDYTRVLPMPNPSGLDFPTLAWSFAPNTQGTSAMGKLADDNFTSTFVSLRTETVITMWVIDDKMHNGVTAVVCRTIKINGQTLNVGTTIYGHATFTLGNDGIVR